MNITRRGFLQGAIGLAGAGMTGALTVPALKTYYLLQLQGVTRMMLMKL